jgi:hypothetical protein
MGPCVTQVKIRDWLKAQDFDIIDWPGYCPDLNPIQTYWNMMKNKLKDIKITSLPHLEYEIKEF